MQTDLSNFIHYEPVNCNTDPHNYLIIGKRCVGKTNLVKNIANYYTQNNFFTKVYLFGNYNDYSDIVTNPENIIKSDFISQLEKILLGQKEACDKNQMGYVGLIIDGCDADTKLFKSGIFFDLISNVRSWKIKVILTLQYPVGISPEIRQCFDNLYIFADEFIPNIKRIHEHYFSQIIQLDDLTNKINGLEEYEYLFMKTRGEQRNKIVVGKTALLQLPNPIINLSI